MASAEEQLNALRELLMLYLQAKLWGAPRRFEYAGADVKRGQTERQQLRREMTRAHIDVSRRIHEAQKRLLATGYPVLDSWLTVRAVGQLSSEHTGGVKGKRETAVLTDSGADLPALDIVCQEMGVAILRLEAQLGSGAAEGKIEAGQSPVEHSDVPVTLGEFMVSNCVFDSRLTEARLESLTKSLQNAARRKGSDVRLPGHVGSWRPGRKKYYHPSQLRAVWPRLVQQLPFLPPLKSAKP